MLQSLLKIISPVNLKKYGMYAILSFFISFSVLLALDDFSVRNDDIKKERQRNEQLQGELSHQIKLKAEQDSLIIRYNYYKRH